MPRLPPAGRAQLPWRRRNGGLGVHGPESIQFPLIIPYPKYPKLLYLSVRFSKFRLSKLCDCNLLQGLSLQSHGLWNIASNQDPPVPRCSRN